MYGSWILLVMLIISSLPVIAVYAWFRLAKYPFKLTRFLIVLLLGAAAFFPALLLQRFLLPFQPSAGRAALFYQFFFRIAFTEEFSRLVLLFISFLFASLIKTKTDQPITWNTVKKGTATGLVAGLGFAILESAAYAVQGQNPFSLLLLRAVTAAPLHAACGSRVGAAAVMLRSNPVQALFRLLTATAIHGIYNLLVALSGVPVFLAILIAVSAFITSIMAIRGSWEEVS